MECKEGMRMLLAMQIGSAVTGFAAATLWFWSAAAKAPPMTYQGIGRLEAFLNSAGRLNRWAAGVTAVSVSFSAVGTLLTALGGK
jgi:hypothetical protein